MKCLRCQTNPAPSHPFLGYLLCEDCRQSATTKNERPHEFIPASVLESRKEYAPDIIQSSRDGVLSLERLEEYGTRGLKVTPEQIKNAKYVWNDRESLSYKKGNPKLI